MTHDARAESTGLALNEVQAATVREIVQRAVPDAEVWVFGSRATGRARPFSDLDLLFTRPAALSGQQRAVLQAAFEASDLPFPVDVVGAAELTGLVAVRVNAERRPL